MNRRIDLADFTPYSSGGIHVQRGTIDTPFPAHEHGFLELFIVVSGSAVHSIDGRRFDVREGSVYAVQRGSVHAFDEVDTLSLWNIMLAEGYPPLADESLRLLPGYQALFVVDPALPSNDRTGPLVVLDAPGIAYTEGVLRDLGRELTQRKPGWEVASRAGFFLLATHLGREYDACHRAETDTDTRARRDCAFGIARALAYLERNLNRQVQVSELAEEAGLSERHFSRLFRSAYGQPPISYAADLRLERARELLNSGSLVLEEIAERTGYSDAAHLCRVFQTAYGCTPSHFRRAPPTAVHGVFDNRG